MTRLVIENALDDPRSHRHAGPRPELLGVWVEPLGEDYWIARGQRLAFTAASSQPEVDCIWHQQGVSVCFGDADAYGVVVTTDAGEVVECGYQRPSPDGPATN
jgi:hypothetical protein